MAVLLSCSEIGKSIGSRVLFENVSLTLSDGDRIGLIGSNGSGKTTLLEILAGNSEPDEGLRSIRKQARVGYVPQDSVFAADQTVGSVLNAALSGAPMDEIEKATKIQMAMTRAGLTSADTPAAALSGGWKKRLAISAALVTSPDVLLLDEPTNHLDLDGIVWLESELAMINACLVVTHDRYLLEGLATQVTELSIAYPQGTFQVKGNYSEFLERRQDFYDAQSKQEQSLRTQVKREIEWLRRGPKARTGKSRARIDSAGRLIGQLTTMEQRSASGRTQIDFTGSDRKTKRLIEAKGVEKSLGGKTLFKNLDLTISPGMRVGLVGSNGTGKTTLLKVLQSLMLPDQGTIQHADKLRIVNFAQDRNTHLDLTKTLRRSLCPDGDSVIYRDTPVHVAGWAKRFLFREEQLDTPLSRLSGGERARVLIARLMLETADVLLLDEPTNDLDIPTLEVLEESLLEFPGALLIVSHDRYLLDRVATVVVGLDGQGNAELFADYSQWEAWRSEIQPEKTVVEKNRPVPQAAPQAKKKLAYIEQLEWDGMEQKILEAEQNLAACDRDVQESASNAERLPGAYSKLQEAHRRVEDLYSRWAELEAKIPR